MMSRGTFGSGKRLRSWWAGTAAVVTAAGLIAGGGVLLDRATSSRAAPPAAQTVSSLASHARPEHLQGPREGGTGLSAAGKPARPRQVRLSRLALAIRAAGAVARRTGRPAVVAGMTDAQSQLSVRPDGLLDMVSNAQPVRVQVGRAWVPISTRLQRTPDGSWAARLTQDPVWFSPGGRGPLVTIRPRGSTGWVSVYWPARLPAPVVSGSVALYRNVLPGVDLRLEATSPGYAETLVVTSAAAARDPGLRSLVMGVRVGGGLVLRGGADGSLDAVWERSGKVALGAGQSQMWDTPAPGPHVAPASADDAGSGRVTVVPTRYQVAGGTSAVIRMAPPVSALTGRGARSPFYIDPDFDPSMSFFAEVMKEENGDTQAWSGSTAGSGGSLGSGIVQVGYCGYTTGSSPCNWGGIIQTYTNQVYFRFPVTYLGTGVSSAAATVYYVQFSDEETYNSAGCTAEPSSVYSTTGGVSSSTTWANQPQGGALASQSSDAGGGTGCKAAGVDFTAETGSSTNTALLNSLQDDADADAGGGSGMTVTLELRATENTTDLQFKNYSNNPSLEVIFNYPPLTPTMTTDTSASPTTPVSQMADCQGTAYTATTEPTFTASTEDGNPTSDYEEVSETFTVENSSGATVETASSTAAKLAAGKMEPESATLTATQALTSGDAYSLVAKSTNASNTLPDKTIAGLSSGSSSAFDFTVLHQTPPTPTISSYDYPQNYWNPVTGTWLAANSAQPQWGQPAGAPGFFTVGDNGGTDVAGFAYSFTSSDIPIEADSDCTYLDDGGLGTSMNTDGVGGNTAGQGELAVGPNGTAQIMIPANFSTEPGQHTLYVETFDYAHNMSGGAAYTFYVSPDYQSGQTETTIAGSSLVSGASGANASLLTAQANCCDLTWDGNSQLWFEGTASGQTFTVYFTVPGSGADTWQLGADMTTSYNYAEGEFELVPPGSGTPVPLAGTQAVPWDGYSAETSLKYLDLGTQQLTGGDTYGLTFTATGLDPSDAVPGVYMAGINYLTLSPTNRYEGESLATGTPAAGFVGAQYIAGQPWSGNGQLFYNNSAAPGSVADSPSKDPSFTVDFSVPVPGDYALGVNLTLSWDYGEVRFDLDPSSTDLNLANTATNPIDAYSPTITSRYVFLGGVYLAGGPHVLQVTVVGTDPDSINNRYNAGIDYLEAAPISNVTETSLTAAMNNLGIAPQDSGSFAGNLDLFGDNLSATALSDAGITVGTASAPGNTFSLDGATFTMPELQSSSGTVTADNVIAAGQTITLAPSQQIAATGVALLAAATCSTGWTSSSPPVYATLTYGGPATKGGNTPGPSQVQVRPVPDWEWGPSGSAAMTLAYRDVGTTPETSVPPRLYEVMLPANPGGVLQSVTLPLVAGGYGNPSDLNNCYGAQLHVLAIGTRPVSQASLPGGVWDGAYAAPMDEAIAPWTTSLANQTLREVVTPSVPGSGQVRIRLSNAHSDQPVQFDSVTVAAQSAANSPATTGSIETVTFGGSDTLTLPAGADAYSDAVTMPTGGTGSLVVSMHVAAAYDVTSMPVDLASGLVTYYATGSDTGNSGSDFSTSDFIQGGAYLAGVDVSDTTTTDGTVAVLGDQLTTAYPAGSSANWPTDLPGALASAMVALPGGVASTATSGPPPPAHWWQLAGSAPQTTAPDTGDTGSDPLTLQNTAAWTSLSPGTGTSGAALSLDGSSGYAEGSGPAVSTTGSFTVSAWVDPSSLPAHNAMVAAQAGTDASAFYLGYSYTAGGDWAFYFPGSDADSPATWTTVVGPAAAAGTWTHLAGVYNASTGTAQLYVNGALAASASVTPWAATGPIFVGADRYDGGVTDYFPGYISDVRTFSSALTAQQVSEVYNDTGTSTLTTANALPAVENLTMAEPDVRDVIIALGANDVLQGTSAASIESNLTALVTAITSRTDPATGNAVQAFLTTIPPLGLSPADPREAVREQVNEWIMDESAPYACPASSSPPLGYLGAALSIDLACAVTNSSDLAQVNPSLLSSGVPTANYYSDLANEFAEALAAAEPAPNVGVGL
jgi:Concanavalin A-like lectin/glucanases superfamily/GDSL-like Lipase/Acylhydrolase family